MNWKEAHILNHSTIRHICGNWVKFVYTYCGDVHSIIGEYDLNMLSAVMVATIERVDKNHFDEIRKSSNMTFVEWCMM